MQRVLLILMLSAMVAPAGMTAELESHQRILQAARTYIIDEQGKTAHTLKVTAGKLDKRLRLKKCLEPLAAFSPGKRRSSVRQTVGIRCPGDPGWTLYVSAKVELSKPILVANRALARGTRINKGDLRVETRMVSGLHRGYLENPTDAIGRTLKLSVRQDSAITPNQLRPKLDVKRGSPVTILGRAGSIEVRMAGRAHSDGVRGDRIKVTNSSSERELEAVIVAQDTVEVPL